jgi:nucleoside phosphorylase
MPTALNLADVKLNYDPSQPQQRFRNAGLEAAFLAPAAQLPHTVPWPAGAAPVAVPLTPPPLPTDDLTRFKGYDAVVVTWTSAEAAALATLLTPNNPTSTWYLYRHNIDQYIPLVTGPVAPFNDNTTEMARYYHTLALYFPCQIGKAKVLLMKSGLHLDYDGPATPVKKLMTEIALAVQPKLFITTGTGGGIGADVLLGDVIIAGKVRFDCQTQFKAAPFANGVYTPSKLPAGTLEAITPALTQPNASRIPNARPVPKMWSSTNDAIVTTDFFAFDDSTDYYKLQGLGQACDMGDAMVGDALQGIPNLSWHAVRNASDPQIPNPTNSIKTAGDQAAQIYAKYGGLTTAASVIATWAIIYAATK